MSEMIERVAKAIWRSCSPDWPWEDLSETGTLKSISRRQARAAIEAMADPTQAMLEAGEENCGFDGYVNYFEPAIPYRAMVYAALSQDTHSLPSEAR